MAIASSDLERTYEGLSLTAYQDSVGVWTIGYGHTGTYNGVPVGPGMVLTQAEADALLDSDVAYYSAQVENLLARPATPEQFDALVDFAFNEGVTALKNSTLLRRFNAGVLGAAAQQFAEWDVAPPPNILQGLVRRRMAECIRFLSGYSLHIEAGFGGMVWQLTLRF